MKTILTKTVRKTMKRNYNHTGIMTCAVFTLLAIFGLSGLAKAETAPWGGLESGQCMVRSTSASGNFSLSKAIGKYNNTTVNSAWRECHKKITFATPVNSQVTVGQTQNISYPDGAGLEINGQLSDGSKTKLKADLNGDPVFNITSSGDGVVKIHGFVLTASSTAGAFVQCSGATAVEISDVEIQNTPAQALTFNGCTNVTVNGVAITRGTSDTSAAVIGVYNADTVAVNATASGSGDATGAASSVKGTFLDVMDVKVSLDVDVTVSNLTTGVVADLDDVDGLSSFKVTGTRVQNGVVLNRVDGSNLTTVNVNLTGRRYDTDTSGVGIKLDQLATNLRFNANTTVRNFGSDGVQVWDSSNFNKFEGVTIAENLGNGVFITDQARGTELNGAKIKNNIGCGVVLNSTFGTVIRRTELPNNGPTGCPIKVDAASPVTILAESDVILIPTSDNSMQLDVVPTLVGGGGSSAEIMELHKLTRGGEIPTVPAVGKKGKAGKKGAPKKPGASAVSRVASAVVSGELPDSAASDTSYIKEFNLANLPAPVDRNASDHYFTILTTQSGEVVAFWQGKALGSGSLSGLSCYEDPTSSTGWTRVYQQDLDTDGDGVFDHEEDANRNCQVDAGETSPDSADTDGDGLGDFIESKSTSNTSALDNDSDDDGLIDGLEDLNKSGSFEQEYCVTDSSSAQFGWCETDPAKADTDGDTLGDNRERAMGTNPNDRNTDGDTKSDDLDECPLLHPNDGECYYANCAEGVALPSDQDTDEDGVRDDDEDTNNNCQRDATETDVQSDDTDGDGIPDGVEDFNRNGVYEAELGESNPLNTDTDGDGIGDGAEDKNHDGKIESGAGETSPILTDSDGDTLLDNVEDKNKNGAQDPGETSAALADTDGDGMNDNVDPAPWSIKPNTVVYYCDVAGFDQDTDGDGLNDKDEDYNGDCLHTAIEKEPHPLKKDTDTDGLDDGLEACYETNPNVADTDGDGRSDFDEVKASGLTCTNMYNLGGTNPLRAEYGSCSLNTDDATSGSVLPIILMMALAVIPMVVIRRKKEM